MLLAQHLQVVLLKLKRVSEQLNWIVLEQRYDGVRYVPSPEGNRDFSHESAYGDQPIYAYFAGNVVELLAVLAPPCL